MTDLDSVVVLSQTVRQCGARLVVLDNLGLITGDVEENSAGMAQVMGNLRMVVEATKACIVVIHHQRKGGANGSRRGDGLRGHSSIEAAIDLALHVSREPDSSDITIMSTKTRGVDVPTVSAGFEYRHRAGTNDLELAWYYGKAEVRGANPVRDAIVGLLREYPDGITKGRLVDAVHEQLSGAVGVNKIRNWIDEMIKSTKELTTATGDKNAQIILLS
jgi:hypothetical protein